MKLSRSLFLKSMSVILCVCMCITGAVFTFAAEKCANVTTTPNVNDVYFVGDTITLQTQTEGATIYYAIDDENSGWTGYYSNTKYDWIKYTKPIEITTSPFIIYTYCEKEGFDDSDIGTHIFRAQAGVNISGSIENDAAKKVKLEVLNSSGDVVKSSETTSTSFSSGNIAAGTYTVKITKESYVPVYIENVIVKSSNVNLTSYLKDLTIPRGDINSDGVVDSADITIMLNDYNYSKNVDESEQPLCDMNDDGTIDSVDITVVLLEQNFSKSSLKINY